MQEHESREGGRTQRAQGMPRLSKGREVVVTQRLSSSSARKKIVGAQQRMEVGGIEE
jgi:hypothetical protein